MAAGFASASRGPGLDYSKARHFQYATFAADLPLLFAASCFWDCHSDLKVHSGNVRIREPGSATS